MEEIQTSSDAFVLSDPVVSDQTARSGGLRSEVDEEKFPQQHAAHSVSGFKLRQSMDCALDTAIIKVCDFASPGAKAMRMTPNILTTISVVFKLLALYSLHFAKSKQLFVVFASLAYVFDCFDGHFARKYGMVSKFGDYYDHISDWSYFFALFVIALMNGLNLSTWLHVCVLILVLVFACSASLHMACQEQIYSLSNPESCEGPSLRFLTLIAKQIGDPKTMIRYTRYGGVGVFVVSTIVFSVFVIQ